MEEIQQILSNYIPFLKVKGTDQQDKIEPYNGYNDIVDKYHRVLVHSQEGFFPEKLFQHRAPNETDVEYKYRKDNYKQITLPVFLDYLNTRGRAWHSSNWSIKYNEDNKIFSENTLRKYLENDLYIHGSLINFFNTTLPKIKAQDPNGVIVVKPYKFPYIETENGNVLDDTTLLEPTIYYYSCERVLYYKEDEYSLIELDEKSLVEKNGKLQKIGYILELHTPNAYYHIKQIGKYVDFKFEIEEVLTHNWGQMLCAQLMGLPNFINNRIVWESPFSYAIENLDLALLKSSNLLIAESKCAFPVRVMLGNECDFNSGEGSCMYGQITIGDRIVTCPSCHGTGLKNRVSPNGEILYNAKELQETGISASDVIQYANPDSTILEYLREGIKQDIDAGRKILHLSTTNDTSNSNSETATLNNLENKALMSFVSQIANQEFELFEWCIDAIGYLRYGNLYSKPIISRPQTFDFTTEADYLELLKVARDSGAPSMVIRYIMEKYISNIYFSKEDGSNAFNLLLSIDRVFEFNDLEIKTKLLQGLISKEDEIIHTSGIFIIKQLVSENTNFFEQPIENQKAQVLERAKQMVINE